MMAVTDDKLAYTMRPERIALIGIGGAGGNVLDLLAAGDVSGPSMIAINTDCQALEKCRVPARVQIGARLTRGLGAAGDSAVGRMAAEEDAAILAGLCADKDLVIIIAGLGGGTGSGAAVAMVRIAHENNCIAICVLTLPFDYEGEAIRTRAMTTLDELRDVADAVLLVPNQRLFASASPGAALDAVFAQANAQIAAGVSGVWHMLVTHGFINITLADIRVAAQKSGGILVFNNATARGPDRATQVARQLLESPLLDGGRLVREADILLLSIVGGEGTAYAEVESVVASIRHAIKPQAQVRIGPALTAQASDRLSVTLIVPEQWNRTGADGAAAAEAVAETILKPPAAAGAAKPTQAQLTLDAVSQGRFKDVEPTLYKGENLDIPTYRRRGLVLDK